MDRLGITQENKLLVGVGQGYRMMNALKTTERRLAAGTFLHAKSSLMNWCVRNLKIEPTATAIRATKQNAGDAKIDPAMAMFNAVDILSLKPRLNPAGKSYGACVTQAVPLLKCAAPPRIIVQHWPCIAGL
jgi:phage terminase large subunit-like protein